MTGGAAASGSRCARRVQRMIEPHIKTLQWWKSLQRAGGNVRVADYTDRIVRIVEALRVAAGAGCVTGKRDLRRVVFTAMADEARERGVCLRVREL